MGPTRELSAQLILRNDISPAIILRTTMQVAEIKVFIFRTKQVEFGSSHEREPHE